MTFLRTFMAIAMLALVVATAGCNTFRGFGRDVERGGERIQDTATGVQEEIAQ